MSRFIIYFLCFSIFSQLNDAQISDKRLCVDAECKSPISYAKTLIRYFGKDEHHLSFQPNQNVVIYSKSAGSNTDLWGAEINGKRGYLPKSLVKETRIIATPSLLVDTETSNSSNVPQVEPIELTTVNPSKVKQKYEVIDGTTIYNQPGDNVMDDIPINQDASGVQVESSKSESEQKEEQKGDEEAPEGFLSGIIDNMFGLAQNLDSNTETTGNETDSISPGENIEEGLTDKPSLDKVKEENVQTESAAIIDEPQRKSDLEFNKEEAVKPDEPSVDNNEENSLTPEKTDEDDSSKNLEPFLEPLKDLPFLNDKYVNNNVAPEIVDNNIENPNQVPSSVEEKINEDESSSKNIEPLSLEPLPSVNDSYLDPVPALADEKTDEDDSSKNGNIEPTVSPYPEINDNNILPQHDLHTTPSVENINTTESVDNNIESLKEPNETSDNSVDDDNKNRLESINEPKELGDTANSDNIKPPEQEESPMVNEDPQLPENITETPDNLVTNEPSKYIEETENKEESQKTNPDQHIEDNKLLPPLQETQKVEVKLPESNNEVVDPYGVNETEQKIEENVDIPNNINYSAAIENNETSQYEENEKPKEIDNTESQPSGIFSLLDKTRNTRLTNDDSTPENPQQPDVSDSYCSKDDCPEQPDSNNVGYFEFPTLNSDFALYLITTAFSVILFLLGYFALDKSKREGPLIVRINKLEKELLILQQENESLTEKIENRVERYDPSQTEEFVDLKLKYDDVLSKKISLEEQVQNLEKELENSTEVGLELNRMLTEILNSENAGETLISNIESLQSQLVEQQNNASEMKDLLTIKETEIHEITSELDISNKKVVELQTELDKLLLNIIKLGDEKELLEKNSASKIDELNQTIFTLKKKLLNEQEVYSRAKEELTNKLFVCERNLQLKIKEYEGLKENLNSDTTNNLDSILEVTSIKAELDQLRTECETYRDTIKKAKESNALLDRRAKTAEEEIDEMKKRYDEVDKVKLELETKLQVLTNYFKEREEQLQKELSKYESMWSTKQGEATTTSERVKYLQSEIQNYKTLNETLKQEIVSQEVELKSRISVLEKKVHENWLTARQAERRLEDLKQEAAQLRNRLTLRERALQEEKSNQMMDQNGTLPISPIHLDSPSSPPPPSLLFNHRDHITKSPPLMGMPPPFLPPPPGAPFLPPPHLPFMPPPPPDMFPGDHRPPPLGRMSSPPLNSRYSPDPRSYMSYERRSPSPSYDESEYATSPVRRKRYSPFSQHGRKHSRKANGRSGALSSESGSNDSLDELNHSSKV